MTSNHPEELEETENPENASLEEPMNAASKRMQNPEKTEDKLAKRGKQ